MPDFNGGNFVAWMGQAFLLASAGALLPMLFRIRDPKTKLLYCHGLLAVILLLPWIEPLRGASAARPAWLGFVHGSLILRLLMAGVAVKLGWLSIGLWRIRRDRIASMPLYPIPEPVRAASAVTQTDALFCISPGVTSPVMLGWLTPVVLLPESFLSLSEEAQCGIACHELLHVRRHDWLTAIAEELMGTALWLNPAIWPLLAQARLAREQLVDAEVVRLIASRESYIEALLAIARGGGGNLDLAPAPLFLRKRHLAQRVHLLLKDGASSGMRLIWSYASMTVLLGLTGWFGAVSFPLIGRAAPERPTQMAPVVAHVEQPGTAAVQPPRAANPDPQPAPVEDSQTIEDSQTVEESQPSSKPAYASALPPADPHEPVSGLVRINGLGANQAAAIALFNRATRHIKPGAEAMARTRFDIAFTTDSGAGHFSEIFESPKNWRWTVTLGDYALDRVISSGKTMGNAGVTSIPMRVHDMIAALPWILSVPLVGTQIRTADVRWNGAPVTCLLASNVNGKAAATQARLWEEREYCIDTASGLLQVYSVAPGTYTIYSYGGHLDLRGEKLPDRITTYINGATTLDAQLSVTDASPADFGLLTPPPEMTSIGVVAGLINRFPMPAPNPASSSNLIQPVIVHTEMSRDGAVIAAEVSAAADPALAQAAMDLVKRSKFAGDGLIQQQAFINVRFQPPEK